MYKPLVLPRKAVNIMGDVLRIRFVNDARFIGVTSARKGLIKISKYYPKDVQREGLLHEISEYILLKMNCGTWHTSGGVTYHLKHDPAGNTDIWRTFIASLLDTIQRNKLGKVLFK